MVHVVHVDVWHMWYNAYMEKADKTIRVPARIQKELRMASAEKGVAAWRVIDALLTRSESPPTQAPEKEEPPTKAKREPVLSDWDLYQMRQGKKR